MLVYRIKCPPARSCCRGAALIEFVLAAPVFFVFVVGLIQFALAFSDYLALVQIGRHAARTAAVSPAPGLTCSQQVKAAAQQELNGTFNMGLELRDPVCTTKTIAARRTCIVTISAAMPCGLCMMLGYWTPEIVLSRRVAAAIEDPAGRCD